VTLSAVILLLTSAVSHAGWNVLGKRQNPAPAFFLAANTLGCLCLLPAVLVYRAALAAFSGSVWCLLIATGLCQAIYYAGLASAYRQGDMSVAYPLARSLPVLLVALVGLSLGQASQVSQRALLGMLFVLAGGLLLPIRRLKAWSIRDYAAPSSLWALVAALGTTGYSIIDDRALHIVRASASTIPSAGATAVYAFFEGLVSSLWLALFVLVTSKGREEMQSVNSSRLRQAFLTGVGIYFAYTLVLIAMAYVTNVSYVVAFRQSSIVLGTLVGVTWLREPFYPCKLIGVASMFLGLVLVGTG
jgi:drug/metabolite transporter (DMT)-like permease